MPRGSEVNAEGLLAEKVDSCFCDSNVQIFVQVVRYGEVQHIDVIALDELAPVVRERLDGGNAAEPVACYRVGIGDSNDAWRCGMVDELRPASAHDCQLAAHEAAANDADPDGPWRHDVLARIAPAAAASAPSWSMAMSARVIPPGLSCWMMLRPYTIPAAPCSSTV